MWKRKIIDTLKNIPGKSSRVKMVAFAVDDYGNVRINGPEAHHQLLSSGLKAVSRFDHFDTLETREDLEALFEVLSRYHDERGKPAVFTPYAVSGNLDFETLLTGEHHSIPVEPLPITFAKLAASKPDVYEGAWLLWQDGIEAGLMRPQYHGGEHFNHNATFSRWLTRDPLLRKVLETRSFGFLRSLDRRGIYATYEFESIQELASHQESLVSGYKRFERVFGTSPVNFTPPNYSYHDVHMSTLGAIGVKYIDTAMWRKENLGEGKHVHKWHYMGQNLPYGLKAVIRNAVFEPTKNDGIDWITFVMKQAEMAFFWNKPLFISTHRVNFCGWIDPDNRKYALSQLDGLLNALIQRWPDINFVSAEEMCAQLFETDVHV
jgi:hypothetical protein